MGEWISSKKRTQIYERDKYTCRYCNKHLSKGELSLDHIVPRAKGGKHNIENLVTACPQCQWKKGYKLLDDIEMNLIKNE